MQIEKIEINSLEKSRNLSEWKDIKFDKEINKCCRILPDKYIEGFFVVKIKKAT